MMTEDACKDAVSTHDHAIEETGELGLGQHEFCSPLPWDLEVENRMVQGIKGVKVLHISQSSGGRL